MAINAHSFAATNIYQLNKQQWNVPRQALTIISIASIRDAVNEYQSSDHNRLLIKYPGGDYGTLWAYELRSWLVSLGISSRDIELAPGSTNPDIVELSVLTAKHD